MLDSKLIAEYLPTIEGLAKKYENDYHDYDELYSEGQLVLVEYLTKNSNDSRANIKGRLWSVINHRLRKLSKEVDEYRDFDVNGDMIDLISRDPPNMDFTDLYNAINSLKEREQDVIKRYYGFDTNKQTLEEIGQTYNISKVRVKTIRQYAEYKIKTYLHSVGKDTYSDCEEQYEY